MNGKHTGKVLASCVIFLGSLAGNVKANWINVKCNSSLNNPSVYLLHYSAGSEGLDGLDASNPDNPPNLLDIYSKTSFPYPNDRLSQEARGANSMTTFTVEIIGNSLQNPPISANLSTAIDSIGEENNMVNKKILGKLYDANGTGDPGDDILLGTYDLWNMHESGQTIPLSIKDGISHRFEVSFNYNNIADFNNDEDVNFEDFAMLANDWKKPIGNYLADISGPAGLSDGIVDEYDLAELAANWLEGV